MLGEAATEELLAAWGEAYWFLTNILQARIRGAIEDMPGGWHGWRRFRIVQKIQESSVITSFILRPVDRGPVVPHKPGQYLTFRLPVPGQSELKRNYSISCAPNSDYYRISVKREADGQGGSRFLHDLVQVGAILEVTPPAGDFFLPDEPRGPVVLLSGGVGLTPMVSMVETIAQRHPDLEAFYVHGTLSSATHALDDHVRDLARRHGRIAVTTFYNEPGADDRAGETFDHAGIISTDWLQRNLPFDRADFYLCGPKPFLRAFVSGLSLAGVEAGRIHYEFFGPADDLLAA